MEQKLKLKFSHIRWTDEFIGLGIMLWRFPYQFDLNLLFFRISLVYDYDM